MITKKSEFEWEISVIFEYQEEVLKGKVLCTSLYYCKNISDKTSIEGSIQVGNETYECKNLTYPLKTKK